MNTPEELMKQFGGLHVYIEDVAKHYFGLDYDSAILSSKQGIFPIRNFKSGTNKKAKIIVDVREISNYLNSDGKQDMLWKDKILTEKDVDNLRSIYKGMNNRCYRANHRSYKHYGGRGIIICDRWLESVYLFANDMGKRPSTKHSIDRIDNDGIYEPLNCRWATAKEQANNKMNNKTKSTFDYLIDQHGCNMIPLENICIYAGYKTLKAAKEKAITHSLPFPSFKTGGRNGVWFVNAEHLAKYLDDKDKEYTEKHDYCKTSRF